MKEYENVARNLKSQGNNCSYSLYNAFADDLKLSGDYPEPRSIEGKCGALLTALHILKETGHADKIKKFEEDFIKEFGYSKCMDLMRYERRCNDYVGWSASKLSEIILKNYSL